MSWRPSRSVIVAFVICAAALAAWLWTRTRVEDPQRSGQPAPTAPAEVTEEPHPAALAPVVDRVQRTVVDAPEANVDRVRESATVARPRGRLPPLEEKFAPHIRTPAGVLEVIVLEDGDPVRNVPVAIVGPNVEEMPERLEDVVDPTRWSRTDARGLVRFEELPPGTYAIRAWVGPASVYTGHLELTETGAFRFYLRIGTGVVHGTAHESLHVPWPDARIDLQLRADEGHNLAFTTRTDAHGRFRFERLPSGFCIVMRESWGTGLETHTGRARFQLERGETIELSFGSLPVIEWTGTLRASSGEALEFTHDVEFDDAERGNAYVGRTDLGGRFRFALPMGEYLIGPEDAWGVPGFLRVELGPEPLQRNLVVPGIVVRVTTPPGEFARYTTFELVPDDPSEQPIAMSNALGNAAAGRERHALRVPAARYRLRARGSGTIAGAPPGGIALDLTGKTGLVTLAVDLVPR